MIHLNREQVHNDEYKQYDPYRHDFRWNADYTEVDVIPLAYWDDASYADYQGDPGAGYED